MKKVLSLGLILGVCGSLITGCSNKFYKDKVS